MAAWYSKKWVTVLLHAAAWFLLFSLPFLLRPSMNNAKPSTEEQHSAAIILRYILNDIIYIGFFYLNAGFLIPKFIYRRKYKEYALAITASFLLLLLIGWLLIFGVMDQRGFNLSGHILFNFFFFLFFFAGSTAYKLTMDRARADRIAREKQTENLKTELSLLAFTGKSAFHVQCAE
jgi:fatty acid desaturase